MIIQYITLREVFKRGLGCQQVCNHLVYLPLLPPPQMVANGYKPITIHNQLYKRMLITLHLQFIIDRTKSNMRPRKLRWPGQKLPLLLWVWLWLYHLWMWWVCHGSRYELLQRNWYLVLAHHITGVYKIQNT